jgi:anthranilate synthase component 1
VPADVASVRRRIDLRPGALAAAALKHPDRYPVLFDSAAQGALARASILVAFPTAALWKTADGRLHVEGRADGLPPPAADMSFLTALESWLAREGRAARSHDPLPFTGGWAVFLGYEIGAEIEARVPRAPGGPEVEAFALRVRLAVVDEGQGRGVIVAEPGVPAAQIEQLAADLAAANVAAAAPVPDRTDALALSVVEEDPQLYIDRVLRGQEYIRAGDVYQANLSRPWRVQLAPGVGAADLYPRLRRTNPAPFAALTQFRGEMLLSSSPERLLRIDGDRIDTRPIAGTHPRGATAEEDRRLAEQLLAHPKERAEHVMLIDLERNDLGRVCSAGTVRVDEYMAVETYAHVHHIVSNVSGQLRPGVTVVDALRAVFPGGTITGCPKLRCMQIIAELEGEARGAYTGSLGYINLDGSADFNILIRTMTLRGSALGFRAGAGIVADSDARREVQETRAKARGMLLALGAAASP